MSLAFARVDTRQVTDAQAVYPSRLPTGMEHTVLILLLVIAQLVSGFCVWRLIKRIESLRDQVAKL